LDVVYLVEARSRSNNLRKEVEFASDKLVTETPRRHQIHFQEVPPVPNKATHVQVGIIPKEYDQWKEGSQLAKFRLQKQSKLQQQTQQ
jgi:hypothetical protein